MKKKFVPPLVLDNNGGDASQNFPIDLRIFSQRSDRNSIYALRYRAFVADNLIAPSHQETFSDRFDDLPSTFTIGGFHNGSCVASLRLAFCCQIDAAPSMPCQEIFREVGELDVARRGILVEFTRMVVAPDITNLSFRTTLYGTMVRTEMIVANAGYADYALIAVSPKMAPFYKAMCGFKFVAGPRAYPNVKSDVVLLGRDFGDLDHNRQKRSAFFRVSSEEIEEARAVLRVAEYTANGARE